MLFYLFWKSFSLSVIVHHAMTNLSFEIFCRYFFTLRVELRWERVWKSNEKTTRNSNFKIMQGVNAKSICSLRELPVMPNSYGSYHRMFRVPSCGFRQGFLSWFAMLNMLRGRHSNANFCIFQLNSKPNCTITVFGVHQRKTGQASRLKIPFRTTWVGLANHRRIWHNSACICRKSKNHWCILLFTLILA